MNLFQQTTYAVMTMPQTDGGDHQTNHRVNNKINLASSPESMGEVWFCQVADAMIESHFNGLELAKTV